MSIFYANIKNACTFVLELLTLKHMNNFSKHLVFTLLLLFTSLLNCAAVDTNDDNKKETTTIVPVVVTKGPQDFHRSLTPEIEAYYSNGHVTVFFYGVSGGVTVTVYNTSNGGQVQNFFDASNINVVIDIRNILTPGEYIVEFELDNFDTCIGEFSL